MRAPIAYHQIRVAAVMLGLLTSACVSVPPQLAEVIVQPRGPGRPAAACVVSGAGDPATDAAFDVFNDPSTGASVAVVRKSAHAPAQLSKFTQVPAAREQHAVPRRALARFEKRGVRLAGWVNLDKRTFTIRRKLDILGPHLWAEAGTRVRLWGTVDRDRLLASAPSPFDEPKRVAFAVPCELLEYGQGSPKNAERARGSRAHALPGRLQFFAGPDGAPVFSAVTKDLVEVEVLDRQLDRVHIVVGKDPIRTEGGGTLYAQGWVPVKSLGKAPPDPGQSGIGSILDGQDRCPQQTVSGETEILLGSPRGLAVAVLEAGTRIRVLERQGEFVAIELENGIFGPPAGAKWWIHGSAIKGKRSPGVEDEDGCPE